VAPLPFRLHRARPLHRGQSDPDKVQAHHPEIDAALAQAVVWASEAKNLNLMSLYEGRIHRRMERTLKMLKQLQAERKAAFQQAVEEATLLAQCAASQGEPYNIETDFPPEALPPQFAFSLAEIARRAAHNAAWETPKSTSRPPSSPSARLPETFFTRPPLPIFDAPGALQQRPRAQAAEWDRRSFLVVCWDGRSARETS